MIEAQKRKANREALRYNGTAGCCHFCFSHHTTIQSGQTIPPGRQAANCNHLGSDLKKSAVALRTSKLVVFDSLWQLIRRACDSVIVQFNRVNEPPTGVSGVPCVVSGGD